MRVALWSLVVASAACLSPAPGPPGPPGPRQLHIALTPRVYHLANGLTAILVQDPTADLTSMRVQENVGAVDDPVDHPGLAHLAAHLSYATLDGKLTRWDQLDRIGTNIEIAPMAKETAFVARFDMARLPDALKIEASRLAVHCDAGTPRWFPWLRRQVSAEVRSSSNWLVDREYQHAAFAPLDPQFRRYDAKPESIEAISQDDACAFLDRYYVPANATVVVSGPIDAATFEHAIKAILEPVAGGTANVRVTSARAATAGTDTTISADVNEPELGIAYTLPADRAQRTVMTFALELLAVKVDAGSIFVDEDLATLWFPEHVLDAASALSKIKAALQTGLVDPTEFEATRTRRVTELLGRLDSQPTRLGTVAESVDLDAPFKALDQVSSQGFEQFVAAHLDLGHARIFRMQPNGAREKWRPIVVGSVGHALIGPSSFVADVLPEVVPKTSRVLANSRTLKLANGMTVILMPTSPIPIIDIRLVFNVGTAAEPETHRGTASLAVSAIDEMAARTHTDTRWAVGTHSSGADFDSSDVVLRGPALDSDLLIGQFDGLAHERFQLADFKKGRDELAKSVHSPMQHLWDQSATLRATTFGSNHPYGRVKDAGQADIDGFDEKVVQEFFTKFLQPNNATVIVTGGFEPDAIEPIIHHTFDGWAGKGEATPVQAAHITAIAYAVDEARPTVAFHVTWQGGLMDDHYEARWLLAGVMGVISADFHGRYVQHRQGGTYELGGVFDPATAPKQIAGILSALPTVAAGGPNYTYAFETARQRQARWMAGEMGSAATWGSWLVFGLENGRDPAWLAGMAKRAAAVTFSDIAQLVRTELTLDRANIMVSGPHDAVAATYAALGITPTWLPH